MTNEELEIIRELVISLGLKITDNEIINDSEIKDKVANLLNIGDYETEKRIIYCRENYDFIARGSKFIDILNEIFEKHNIDLRIETMEEQLKIKIT